MNNLQTLKLALEALEAIFKSTPPYTSEGETTLNDRAVMLSNLAFDALHKDIKELEEKANGAT